MSVINNRTNTTANVITLINCDEMLNVRVFVKGVFGREKIPLIKQERRDPVGISSLNLPRKPQKTGQRLRICDRQDSNRNKGPPRGKELSW